MSFDIALAKTQVRATSVLALPYFLDACDELEALRSADCPCCGASGEDIIALRQTLADKQAAEDGEDVQAAKGTGI